MNTVEIYRRQIVKIFNQVSETAQAAETDANLKEGERYAIKLILQQTRSKLAAGFFNLTQLCNKHDETCDTQQSSTSRK